MQFLAVAGNCSPVLIQEVISTQDEVITVVRRPDKMRN